MFSKMLANRSKKKNQIKITAHSPHQDLIDYFPVSIANKNYYPEWFKKLPVPKDKFGADKNVRLCTGLSDLFKKTLIIPCWQDYEIAVKPDGTTTFNSPNKEEYPVESHIVELQATNAWPGYKNIKLISPWTITSNNDVFYQMSQASWNNSDPCLFHIITGLVEFKYQHATHINMLVPILDYEYIFRIPAGEPLVYLTPLTEKKIQVTHKKISNEERFQMLKGWEFTFNRNYHEKRKLGKRRKNN